MHQAVVWEMIWASWCQRLGSVQATTMIITDRMRMAIMEVTTLVDMDVAQALKVIHTTNRQ